MSVHAWNFVEEKTYATMSSALLVCVCQVNWYITEFKCVIPKLFSNLFLFLSIFFSIRNLLLFCWRLTCATFHFDIIMKFNWQALFCVCECNCKAWTWRIPIAYLINNIFKKNSNRKNKPLHFTSLHDVKCRIFQLQSAKKNINLMQKLSWCCQTICNLLKMTIFFFTRSRCCNL